LAGDGGGEEEKTGVNGEVLAVADDDAALRGGVGEGEEEHLGFRVRVGVECGKLAGDETLGFGCGGLVSAEVKGG
jgi:hypothetical protein